MKRYGNFYPEIYAFSNLVRAARQAQKGKRTKPNVARFNFRLEHELLTLQQELQSQTWTPGRYTSFYIYEPKRRLISAAPYRDRVVHHALCNVIEPIFERSFIPHSYANRIGKGAHRAVDQFSVWCRKKQYVLKADIKKYFPSIDHEILYRLITRKIKDPDVLNMVRRIIDSSNPQEPVHDYFPGDTLFTPYERRRGIPIGNLTSQFFANIYLTGFDRFVTRELGCRHYIRYVDDFVALSDSKSYLHEVKAALADYLSDLRVKLHETKCQVFPAAQGTAFLGYRIFPTHRLLKRDNVRRMKKRLKKQQKEYEQGRLSLEAVQASLQSWIAHAAHADTYGLRRHMLGAAVFRRG